MLLPLMRVHGDVGEHINGSLEYIKAPIGSGMMKTVAQVAGFDIQAKGFAEAVRAAQMRVARAAVLVGSDEHGVVIAILCVFTLLSLSLSIYLLASSASQRVSLRLRESDLEEREQHLTVLEQSLSDTQQELLDAKDELSQQAQTIEELQRSFSSAQSTVSQTQYDMTTQQAELERATQENKALQQENEALEQSVETLTATNEELASSNRLFLSKSKFMDSYVVFVENDGSGLYHKYGCDDFAQTSFWAYSRKLAEANGYKPCPRCFG